MPAIQLTKRLHDTVNEKRDVLKDEDGNYTYDTVPLGYDVNKLTFAK